MSKQEHPYAQVLRWIADGETVEWQTSDGFWRQLSWAEVLEDVARGSFEIARFRLKPRTISINGHEVPEPMRVAPDKPGGVTYYVPWFSAMGHVAEFTWNDILSDRWMFSCGLCHTTREAAEAHARALLSFTTTEQS